MLANKDAIVRRLKDLGFGEDTNISSGDLFSGPMDFTDLLSQMVDGNVFQLPPGNSVSDVDSAFQQCVVKLN